jgi:chromosome segregation ATPase
MSTKKPREPRKPLDQSFLEFVHGGEIKDSSAISQPEPETVPTPDVSQFEHQLMELRDRFAKLELVSSEQNNPRFSQFEAQLTQLKQKIEQMEMHVAPQMAELQHRLIEVEQASSAWDTRYSSQADQLTQLRQNEQMDQNTNQPLTDLQQRFNQLEKTLLDRESQHFSQIDSRLTHLTQQVEQLDAHFRQLLAELQHRPPKSESAFSNDANYVSPVVNQSTQQMQPIEQPEVKSQPPATKPVGQAPERRSEADSLLSRIGPLLDDF